MRARTSGPLPFLAPLRKLGRAGLFAGAVLGAGCAPEEPGAETPPLAGDLKTDPAAPDAPTCSDCAEAKFPDVAALFERSLHRTCSPNFGVCHNSRQQPDLSTLAGFLGAIGQRCNGLRDDPATIDNLCEPPGDLLRIANGSATFEAAIGRVELVPEGATAATATQLRLTLQQAAPERFPPSSILTLVRRSDGLPPLSLALPAGVLATALELGKAQLTLSATPLRSQLPLPATRLSWLGFFWPEKYTPGSPQQVVLADPNRDGVYGAELGGLQIKPGAPQRSYLLLRMVAPMAAPGPLTNTMPKAPLLESQMPLANFDYWDLRNATYALYCWVKGLSPRGDNALRPIDYRGCGALPAELTPQPQGGEATTFSAIYSTILRPQCATVGCHDTQSKAAGLDLSELARAHVALWNQPSTQSRELRLVHPQSPEQSYLVHKLRGTAAAPFGARMPLGRELPDRERAIAAIATWISQGARNN